jgi:hypothetical protein
VAVLGGAVVGWVALGGLVVLQFGFWALVGGAVVGWVALGGLVFLWFFGLWAVSRSPVYGGATYGGSSSFPGGWWKYGGDRRELRVLRVFGPS